MNESSQRTGNLKYDGYKTFIGRSAKGIDWMGFWFTDQGCQSVAPRAINNHRVTLRRLYEQIRHLPAAAQHERVARYYRGWQQWSKKPEDLGLGGNGV